MDANRMNLITQKDAQKDADFQVLTSYLSRVPAVQGPMGSGTFENGNWWVRFTVDIDHPQAWNVVQELGHVLNYLSLEKRLPTSFQPKSPPPYLNGPARDYLFWVIESTDPEFTPGNCLKFLAGRLPRPVDDLTQWPDPKV